MALLKNPENKLPPKKSFKSYLLFFLAIGVIIFSAIYSSYFPSQALIPEIPSKNINVDSLTKLSIHLDRTTIHPNDLIEQVFPLVVSLKTLSLETPHQAPVDLAIVTGDLGNYWDHYQALIKYTIKLMLEEMNDQDRLSVVLFCGDCYERSGSSSSYPIWSVLPLTNTTARNHEKILTTIDTVTKRGSKKHLLALDNPLEAAKIGQDILNEREKPNNMTGIFQMVFGCERNPDKDFTLKHEAAVSGFLKCDHGLTSIMETAFLSGLGYDEAAFLYLDTLGSLAEYFVASLRTLQSSIGKSVEFFVEPEKGVEIVKVYGDESLWKKEGGVFRRKISSLIPGSLKDFLFDIKIPKFTMENFPKEVKIASFRIVVTLLDGNQIAKTSDLFVKIQREETEGDENQEIKKNYLRVKGDFVIEEVAKKTMFGQYQEAMRILKGYKETLENSGVEYENMESVVDELIDELERRENGGRLRNEDSDEENLCW